MTPRIRWMRSLALLSVGLAGVQGWFQWVEGDWNGVVLAATMAVWAMLFHQLATMYSAIVESYQTLLYMRSEQRRRVIEHFDMMEEGRGTRGVDEKN